LRKIRQRVFKHNDLIFFGRISRLICRLYLLYKYPKKMIKILYQVLPFFIE